MVAKTEQGQQSGPWSGQHVAGEGVLGAAAGLGEADEEVEEDEDGGDPEDIEHLRPVYHWGAAKEECGFLLLCASLIWIKSTYEKLEASKHRFKI